MILPRYAIYAALLAAAGLPIYIHGPKFYVDTYGVSLGNIGIALLLLRLIDIIQDPFFGRFVAKLSPVGRQLGAIIAAAGMAIGMLGLFYFAAPIEPIIWMSLCLTLLFSSFSFLSILFYARGVMQGAELGANGHIKLAGWRETGGLLGVTFATMAPFLLAAKFQSGFGVFAVLFAFFVVFAAWLMHPSWHGPTRSIGAGFGPILSDAEIRKLLILAFVNSAPVAVTSSLFLFFVSDLLGAPELAGPLLLGFFVASAVAVPFWSRAAIRFGSIPTLAAGMVLSVAAFGWAYTLGSGDVFMFTLICLASGVALGADMTLLPAMFSTRIKAIGASGSEAFGLWNFAAKLTLAISAASVLPFLDAAGFVSGGTNGAEVLARLSLLYAALPSILKLVAITILFSLRKSSAVS